MRKRVNGHRLNLELKVQVTNGKAAMIYPLIEYATGKGITSKVVLPKQQTGNHITRQREGKLRISVTLRNSSPVLFRNANVTND